MKEKRKHKSKGRQDQDCESEALESLCWWCYMSVVCFWSWSTAPKGQTLSSPETRCPWRPSSP